MQTETVTTSAPTVDVADFLDKQPPEVTEAKALAARYRLPFIDLLPPEGESPIDYDELTKLPVDLMLRNQFVPLRREGNSLHAAMADPSNLERLDELENVLNVRIVPYVATAGAIDVVLRKGDSTQRVLQEAASTFKISLVKETDQGEEVLDLDRLASDSDIAPIIKLVDTILYNAMESRSSDIHIETRERDVQVNSALTGSVRQGGSDRHFVPECFSRIKVMSGSHRRTPRPRTAVSCAI